MTTSILTFHFIPKLPRPEFLPADLDLIRKPLPCRKNRSLLLFLLFPLLCRFHFCKRSRCASSREAPSPFCDFFLSESSHLAVLNSCQICACRDTMGNHRWSGSLSTSLMPPPCSPAASPPASQSFECSSSAPAAPVTAAAAPSVPSAPARRSSGSLPDRP